MTTTSVTLRERFFTEDRREILRSGVLSAHTFRYESGIAHFDIALQGEGPTERGEIEMIEGCTLPMPGDHNVSNCLAAVAVARHLGIKKSEIREALAEFLVGVDQLEADAKEAYDLERAL